VRVGCCGSIGATWTCAANAIENIHIASNIIEAAATNLDGFRILEEWHCNITELERECWFVDKGATSAG